MTPLTKEQQQLVIENHNLIYSYAYENNLPIDDYYGILAISLCKAAQAFKNDKGKFTTIAYNCMHNDLVTYWKSINRKHVIPDKMIMSYDGQRCDDDDDCFLDSFADSICIYDIVSNKLMVETILKQLSAKEKIIFELLTQDMTQSEIARILNYDRQRVYYLVQNIRKKVKKYITI